MKTETLLFILALLVLTPFISKGQVVCVAGQVLDNVTGVTIAQLSIEEKNSGIGTISTEEGSFSLLLKPGEVVLNFFSENYALFSTKFQLKRDTTIQISLMAVKNDRDKKGKKEHQKGGGRQEIAEHPVPDINPE